MVGRAPAQTLGEIVHYDRDLAWVLSRATREEGNGLYTLGHSDQLVVAATGWETISIQATWDGVAADQTIPAKTIAPVASELWVREVMVTVRRPNAFAGSVLKAQSDYFNARNPNINAAIVVHSFCNHVIAEDPTPLEHLVQKFECRCRAGLVFRYAASIDAWFTNLRALAADEIGMNVVVSFTGTRLPHGWYQSVAADKRDRDLREQGLLPP